MTDYIHLFVSGRVQGVGFRYFVLRAAHQFAVTGYVRNLSDGRVEVLAEGDKITLDKFELTVRQGPAFGHVEQISKTGGQRESSFTDFSIKSDSII